MNIGDRIRATRKAAGLSQEEVARRAGLSLKGMGEIERGDIGDPHFSSLVKIAHALRVPVESLIKEEEAVPLAEAPQETGQIGQAWAREQGATLHGMTDAEFNAHVRALGSKGEIAEVWRDFFKEYKMLHAAWELHKWQHPEDKDRRAVLSGDLRKLRLFRIGELAAAAKLMGEDADELFWEIIQGMEVREGAFLDA